MSDSAKRLAVLFTAVTLVTSLMPIVGSSAAPSARPIPTTGLKMWLDASDPDADANPANNPANGAALNVWKDKSGNANDASVLAGKRSGTFRSSTDALINGNAVVQFDRVDNVQGSIYHVPKIDIRPVGMEKVTIFTVYRYYPQVPLVGAMNYGVWGSDNGNWDRFFIALHNGFGDRRNDGVVGLGPQFGGATVVGGGVPNEVRLLTVAYNGNTSSGSNVGPTLGSTVYFDGKVITEFTDTTHSTNAQSTLRIGWDGDNSVFNGDVAEMIIYDRILSPSELNDVNEYLREKYLLKLEDTPLVVHAPDGSMVQGNSAPALAAAHATLAVDESVAVAVDLAPTCAVYADSASSTPMTLGPSTPIGTYVTKCSGGTAPEGYAIKEYVNGTFVVSAKPVLPPSGGTLRAIVPFGGDVTVACLEGATDPAGLPLNVSNISEPAHGSTTLIDGDVRYAAAEGFVGDDEFICTVMNTAGLSAEVTVRLTVRPPKAPIVIPPNETTNIDVIGENGLPENSKITEVEDPEHGKAEESKNDVEYTPNKDYVGPDSVTAVVEKPNGKLISSSVAFTVGLAQTPVSPLNLPRKLSRHGNTTVLDHRVLTNADQYANVRVSCTAQRSRPSGDVAGCRIIRKHGTIKVRPHGAHVVVRITLSAPAKGVYAPYLFRRSISS